MCCDAVRGGAAGREQWCSLHSPLDFNTSLRYPQSNWAPLVLVPQWLGLCTLQAPVGLSNDLSCESLLLLPQPSRAFSIRGLRLYFPKLEPWVAWSASLPAFCPVYLCANVGPQGLLVVRLPVPFVPHSASLGSATAKRVLSTPVPVSSPPTGLDECLFFYFLGVQLPCCSIFCQFWLCKEVQCVYLHCHLVLKRLSLFNCMLLPPLSNIN